LNYYLNTEKYDEAKNNLMLAIEKEPDNKQLHFSLGVVNEKLGNAEEAVKAYENAIYIDPDYFDAVYNLGAFYYNYGVEMNNEANEIEDQKKYEKKRNEAKRFFFTSIPYLESAFLLDPSDKGCVQSLMQTYALLNENKKYQEAKNILETGEGTLTHLTDGIQNSTIKKFDFDFNQKDIRAVGVKTNIELIKSESGTMKVPVTINGAFTVDFIVDSGASFVVLTPQSVLMLIDMGAIDNDDILGSSYAQIADGSVVENVLINIDHLLIGDIALQNIQGSMSSSINAPYLLGMSALSAMGAIIDTKLGVIRFE
jgi:predicted aspartyl protease